MHTVAQRRKVGVDDDHGNLGKGAGQRKYCELMPNVTGPLAQLAEQRTFNPRVVGSSPTGPTVCASQALLVGPTPPPSHWNSSFTPPPLVGGARLQTSHSHVHVVVRVGMGRAGAPTAIGEVRLKVARAVARAEVARAGLTQWAVGQDHVGRLGPASLMQRVEAGTAGIEVFWIIEGGVRSGRRGQEIARTASTKATI
jgi:hypothetical protein